MNAPIILRRLAAPSRSISAARRSIIKATAPSTAFVARKMTTSASVLKQARLSQGSDEASLSSYLDTLLGQGRWTLVNDGEAVERSFKFKNFAKTAKDFMTAVSLQCKTHNHHPEWSNVYNTTFIRWTTHNPKGLSAKDLKLAMICDALAKDFGEIEAPPAEAAAAGETSSCGIRGLADKAAGTAGDCCTPKPKN
ncbi:pterin-4-alpha-carbinolamine dehydratase family protein [Colletotrichum musicola]|uniref:4a-hydroxytetrahydrobiopterin dehydratase n=1 Tax=Colletotrichum musicola TaxID=2175873 RepID=A0A8H6K1L8_9PEZI|nr:pterin-4-alpha-carbinolamine dehydratase family protein [Colletotrichum musicola]